VDDRLTMRDVLELVRDCSSQEWQQPDGKRMAATDNQGRRFWFITDDVMQVVRHALGKHEQIQHPSTRPRSVDGVAIPQTPKENDRG
jgi:hypothetical protein